ncbi:uncharacterized protein [Diadema antillarum]|uniref:uncharacterized protein n=1 Tax=Diadema antillarum TaxID=105358 RepID=UPI003A885E21
MNHRAKLHIADFCPQTTFSLHLPYPPNIHTVTTITIATITTLTATATTTGNTLTTTTTTIAITEQSYKLKHALDSTSASPDIALGCVGSADVSAGAMKPAPSMQNKPRSSSDFNLAVFFELLFSLAESLNSMHLREEDIAVFSALLLLASDLQGLKQKMQVEALQDKVLSGFAYMLSQNHRSKPNLLPQVLMCMPTLRTISTSYLELTAAIPRHVAPPPDSTAMCVRHL